ncbi:MAG: tail fiber domain-containing protein [Flavobacterium sp.]
MKKSISILIIFFILIVSNDMTAQVGIGTTNPYSALDITSTNNGLLIPRVALTNTSTVLPILTGKASELVYNTATTGDVTPGFYYLSADTGPWVRLATTTANSWLITGNTGIVDGTNFIGTAALTNVDVAFRRNNTAAGKIGTTNTSFGLLAASNNGSTHNTAIGVNALTNSTNASSSNNVAIGFGAMDNLGGNNTAQCVAVGVNAFGSATTNSNSVAIGYNAAQGTSTGIDNTAIGSGALNNNSTGQQSTAVGRNALFGSTGSFNIGIGYAAGYNIGAGTNNTCIGYQSDISSGLTNGTAIGNGALCTVSNTMKFGNASVTNNYFSNTVNAVTFTASSDLRYKKEISPISPSLDILSKLQPVNYYFKTEEELTAEKIKSIAFGGDKTHERQVGFIAQEVEKLVPEVVHTDAEGYKSIDYSKFSPFIIKAIQEQQLLIEQLMKTNEKLLKDNQEILKRLEALEKK